MKMLKLLFFSLTVLCLNVANAQTRPGSLRGVITDMPTGETIPFAQIVVKDSANVIVTGGTSDFDGKYNINPIKAGTYSVEVSFIGYAKIELTNIKILPNVPTVKDFKMQMANQELSEVVLLYDAPLIESTKTSTMVTSHSIQAMPVRSLNSVASQAVGVVSSSIIKGSRANSTIYIDGVKIGGDADRAHNLEEYDAITENQFLSSSISPLSTFSSDVDVASYANMRRFITNGQKPNKDAVRIEEMINYFNYDYAEPKDGNTFSVTTELGKCDWAETHQLLRIGIKTKAIPVDDLPPSNLVFLLDVSGSMGSENKLPLLKKAFKLLVNNLREEDRVAIVVYAGASGLALPSTSGENKKTIIAALENLQSGGGTAGEAGIKLAYQTALDNFVKGGVNRVILATDGDFNVGVSNDKALVELIEAKREEGVSLSVLGFGMGNYKDSKMEKLADNGNGNYAYIDNLFEAKKVLVTEMGSTLYTVAKDTKFQIEFNPAQVQAYRLIGYENRLLNDEDFNDDTKDAGDIGAGHSVTAIYELIPIGVEMDKEIEGQKSVDPLKYQKVNKKSMVDAGDEVATVKIRHKKPEKRKSTLETHVVKNGLSEETEDFKFISSVIEFGLVLRESQYKGNSSLAKAVALAKAGKGLDKNGYRAEFIRLIEMADELNFQLTGSTR